MGLKRSCLILVAALLVSACDEAEVPEAPDATLVAVEDLRIGVSVGPEEYMFGRIAGIVQHDDGSISVFDRQVPVIRHYDAEGVFQYDIGRQGQGPGEYSDRVQGIQRLPNGEFAILDSGNSRISVFTPSGDFVRSYHSGTSGYYSASRAIADRDGNLFIYTIDSSAPPPGNRMPPRMYVKVSPEGEVVEQIPAPDDQSEQPGWVFAQREGRLTNFTYNTEHALTSTGALVFGSNEEYRLEIRRGGEEVGEISRPWEPVALKPEERAQWEAWRGYFERRAVQNGRDPVGYEPIPATKPAFMSLHAGIDGTIWVRRYADARERTDRPPREPDDLRPLFTWWQLITLDVFDEEGTFQGTVELPNDTWVSVYHRDWIWTVRPNEDDENILVRYRIEPGS